MFVADSTVISIEADSSITSAAYKPILMEQILFEAVIIACISSFISPHTCITVVDTYGPYKLEAKCLARIEAMRPYIIDNMSPYIPMAWRCQKPELYINPNQKVPL